MDIANQYYCVISTPTWAHFVDFGFAPSLLFYSYVPVILVSIFLSLLIFIKDKFSLQSKLLLLISTFFSVWLLNQIVEWVAVYASVVHFAWQMTAFFEIFIPILSMYFVAVFLNKTDIQFKYKALLSLVALPIIVLLPTTFNMLSFDVKQCQANYGYLWDYIYILEATSIVVMMYMFLNKFRSLSKGDLLRKQIVILAAGMFLFLGMFTATNILGDATFVYQVNLVGPIGMVVFVALLSYMIVKYKTFNIKLLGAQALTVTLWVLVGALFFLSQNMTNRIVTGVTFLLAVVFGFKLMQSVKREVEQRERIEKLAEDLSAANEKLRGLDKLKSEFLSLASHQLRSPMTAIKGYTSMLLEGTFGRLSEQQREINVRILESSQSLIGMIEDFLNVSKIEQGGMQYAFELTNLSKMVSTLFAEMKISAENKHLEFKLEMEEGSTFMANVDAGKLKQVFMNLIDNSIKYTPSGFVHVSLVRDKNKNTITFAVKDSGVGVSPETKDKLFQKFSRGEGGKLNTGGSGLGLYLAQEITKAHKGEIVIESEGLGKGSTFKVTLPG